MSIDRFFTQRFEVRRKTGDGAYGPILDAPAELRGRIKRMNKLVINDRGDQVVSSTQISMTASTAEIPAGSMARAVGDDMWRTVISSSPHVGGFTQSPDYYSIDLE